MFFITHAEFNNFLGFQLPKIKNLKVDFTQKLTCLHSKNGSGKSSFISECNPFPIEKSLFDVGGYKIIRFNYNNHPYEIYSSSDVNKLIDLTTGENLNSGGTKTQHNELIKTLFNLTPFTWDISMGVIDFTTSDKNTRRKWLEAISGIDFGYPFTVYKSITKLCSEHRGAYKNIKEQLAVEVAKLLKEDDIARLIKDKEVLSRDIKSILLSRDNTVDMSKRDQLLRDINTLEAKAKEYQLTYNKLPSFVNANTSIQSDKDLGRVRQTLEGELKVTESRLWGLMEQLERETDLLSKLESHKGVDIDLVNSRVDSLTREIDSLKGELVNCNKDIFSYVTEETKDSYLETITEFEVGLKNYLNEHSEYNEDSIIYPFSIEEYNGYNNTLTDVNNNIRVLGSLIDDITGQIKDFDGNESVDCPECKANFKPHSSHVEDLKVKLAKHEQELIEYRRVKVDDLEPKVASYRNVSSAIDNIIIRCTKALNSGGMAFYTRILKDHLDGSINLSGFLGRVLVDVNTLSVLGKGIGKRIELNKLKTVIDNHKSIADIADYGSVDTLVTKLESDIAEVRLVKEGLVKELASLDNHTKLYNNHVETLTSLQGTLTSLYSCRNEYLTLLDNLALETVENDLQVTLSNITKRVNDNDILSSLISKLEEILISTKEDLDDYLLLDKLINPSTGIIGEQLVGYAKSFSDQLTEVISQLWDYPLRVLPCTIEGKRGMDYKFPFKVGDKPVPDISLGSKSQKGVIDLSVMLCTRITLGLGSLPLYLDEVGGGFDTGNYNRLKKFLQGLLHSYNCSNVFLVSHHEDMRLSLGKSDTIVFHGDNIDIGGDYNENVEIVHY